MSLFERVYVVNLPFRKDRLAVFMEGVPQCLGRVRVWPAIHGDTVRPPAWWVSGNGAWGCYRSHLQILETCYNENVESFLVLEDDAVFVEDCDDSLVHLMAHLPDDWGMLYLGGQLLHEVAHPPLRVNDHCYTPFNVNRTHAYAVHHRCYRQLYDHLVSTPFQPHEHIDHHLGRLHEEGAVKVYCPSRWIVGQNGGSSNISGKSTFRTFWSNPEECFLPDRALSEVHAVFLEAPIEVATALQGRGWHQGYTKNSDGLDVGVCEAIASHSISEGVEKWYRLTRGECIRDGHACVCLYHPGLAWQDIVSLSFKEFTHVEAATVEGAEAVLRNVVRDRWRGDQLLDTRNLCYSISADEGGAGWEHDVMQLRKRLHLFNGVRSISVATRYNEVESKIRSMFSGERIDNWHFCSVDEQGMGERFASLLETIYPGGGITFYGEALNQLTYFPREEVCSTAAYDISLGNAPYISNVLLTYPAALVTARSLEHLQVTPSYRTLIWFRNEDAFRAMDWREKTQSCHRVHDWPVIMFGRSEVTSLLPT